MSHRPAWTCHRCCYVLGEVIAGALMPTVLRPMIGADRVAAICPRCDADCIWERNPPIREMSATSAP